MKPAHSGTKAKINTSMERGPSTTPHFLKYPKLELSSIFTSVVKKAKRKHGKEPYETILGSLCMTNVIS